MDKKEFEEKMEEINDLEDAFLEELTKRNLSKEKQFLVHLMNESVKANLKLDLILQKMLDDFKNIN